MGPLWSKVEALVAVNITALTLLCSGCSNWTGYGHDSSLNFKQPNESALTVRTVEPIQRPLWEFQTPRGGFSASPSVYDNTVYIGGLDGIFYAIYASGPRQGTLRWKYPPDVAPNPPDVCRTTTAPLLESIPGASANPSGPGIASSAAIAKLSTTVFEKVVARTAVIFGAPDPNSNGGDGRLWALDSATGQCIWKSQVVAAVSVGSKIGYSSPAIAHGRAYIGNSSLVPDHPLNTGRVFAVMLNTGGVDKDFKFAAAAPPADQPFFAGELGGGVWSSPAVNLDRASGNLVVTTGNSCRSSMVRICNFPTSDYTMSMLELDWHTGRVIWQLQPVEINYDDDADFGASAMVAHASCGTMAISIQKDGYVHAVDTSNPNPGCSYPEHNLVCPRWSFPTAQLPFEQTGHGDGTFIRPGALDGDRLYIYADGLRLAAVAPNDPTRFYPYGRLHSLDVCASDANRIRWVLDLDGLPGALSVANGIVYFGTNLGEFYAVADTDILPPSGYTCAFPLASGGLPPGRLCQLFGFPYVAIPTVVNRFTITGAIIGAPAIANGQVIVATTHTFGTTGGHVYAFAATAPRGAP